MNKFGYFNDYAAKTGDKAVTKWSHYFNAYERELVRFHQKPISFLEIGVFRGGSLPMWQGYFPEDSTLTFIDINDECKEHEIPGTNVEIGDQSDPEFLQMLGEKYGPFDVILDDGSHICKHQIASFEGLWTHLKNHGLYMVEDCHSSYWPGFGGGYRNEASFIEYAKRLIDTMHSWYTDQDDIFSFDEMARELNGVRIYDSIVVIEKLITTMEPTSIVLKNGKVTRSNRHALQMRGRGSVFVGKDGA